MSSGHVTAAETLRGAMDFTRWAWRRAGLVQAAMAAGVAMMFVGLRASVSPGDAGRLMELGFALAFLAWAPMWAALHRLALGGAAAERVRFGGLQFGRTELRFLGLGMVAALSVVMMILPLIAVSALIFVLFRPLGMVRLGAGDPILVSFLIAAAAWLAGLAGLAYAALRFAFAPAATVSRKRLLVVETWPWTGNYQKSLIGAWLLAQAPTLLGVALLALLDTVEVQDRGAFSSHWPVADAVFGGVMLGVAVAFIAAPLSAGVLGLSYRHFRHWRAHAGARMPLPRPPLARPVARPVRPERGWEPLTIRRAIAKPIPRLDQGV